MPNEPTLIAMTLHLVHGGPTEEAHERVAPRRDDGLHVRGGGPVLARLEFLPIAAALEIARLAALDAAGKAPLGCLLLVTGDVTPTDTTICSLSFCACPFFLNCRRVLIENM